MTFLLKYDTRERGNRRDRSGGGPAQWIEIHKPRRKIEVEREALAIGDYQLFYRGALLILFERKTWDDLAGSLKGAHLDEQLGRMDKVRVETGCTIIIIVEGRRRESHGHVESRALQAKLDHIMLAGRAHIVYTDSTEDTVQRIYELADNVVVEGRDVPPVVNEANKVLSLTKDHGPEQTQLDCFMAVPGLALATARIMIAKGWSLWTLYEADVEILAAISYPSGAVLGVQRARKIEAAMGERKTWIKILEQIQGVTKKTAEALFSSERDLYKWTIDNVANVAKTAKTRVGPVVAKRIIDTLAFRKV
jgi:ERCC4-type nuclease